MKRFLGVAISAMALAACGGSEPDTPAQDAETGVAGTESSAVGETRTAGYNEDRNAYFLSLIHI